MGYAIVGALLLSGIIQLSIGIYVMIQDKRGRNLWFSCLAIAASVRLCLRTHCAHSERGTRLYENRVLGCCFPAHIRLAYRP